MFQPKIGQTKACAKCGEQKPWPSDYITSFKKGTTESACSACRTIRRKADKLKREGNIEMSHGWRSSDSNYRKRSNAIVARINKEKSND